MYINTKSKTLILILVFSLLFTTVLTSCDSLSREPEKTDDSKEAKSTDEKKTSDSHAIIDLGADVPNMNTTTTTDSASLNVIRHAFEGLTRLDKDNNPTPGMAEKWDVSEDKLTYTFTIRDSKWSNGNPVTAKDFEFSLKKLLEKENAAQYAYILYMIKNAEEYNLGKVSADEVGIKAKDDKTLEIVLNSPTPYFLSVLAFGVCMPVNEEFYNGTNGKYGSNKDNLVYNGPWEIKEWTAKDKMVLVKNENYWNKDEIKIDKITMHMIVDGSTRLNKFFSNEIDMIDTEPDKIKVAKDKGVEAQTFGDGATFYLEYNMKDKVTSNLKIRKAISMSIDMDTICKTLLNDVYKRGTTLTHPDLKVNGQAFSDFVGDVTLKYNADEAKKLWAEGIKELGQDVKEINILAGDTTGAKRDSQAIQDYISKTLGVKVNITSVPFKVRLEKMKNQDFQIVLAGWGPDFDDPITFLDLYHSKGGNNHAKYDSKEYDDMIASVKTELDQEKRLETLKNMEVKLSEDVPMFPMYFRYKVYLVKPELKGVVRNPFQDICLYWASVE